MNITVDQVSCYINNFSDLCKLLDLRLSQNNKRTLQSTKAYKALLQYRRKNALPKSIQYHSASTQLIEGLMVRAIQHWCCVSFKIVPIELSLLEKNTPNTILYCVAAISMITINSNNKRLTTATMEGFRKDVGFYFYQKACNYLKEVIFLDDDEDFVTAIQCYFCLSYTSNLLQLFSEQRTWHYLACDALKNKVNYLHVSPALRQCWYRWYYIDAWISIALNQECLLPDTLPFQPIQEISHYEATQHQQHRTCCLMSNETLYNFVSLTQFMRQFNRAIQLGKLPSVYEDITHQAECWWYSLSKPHVHLKICYFSMRLVVLFSLLQHDYKVDSDLLVDGLNVTLEILQGLQDLKLMNCDQSTYHHMFFAIHQTLKLLLCYIKAKPIYHQLETFARQQFEMNLCVLEGTDAFRDDIYQMRRIGSNIESDLEELGYLQDKENSRKMSVHVFRAKYLTFSNKKTKK